MAAPVWSLFADLRLGLGSFRTDTDKARKELGKLAGDFAKSGKELSKSFTLPLVGIAAAAIKSSNDLDKAFQKVRAGTGATGSTIQALRKDFEAVFKDTPASAEEVGQALTIVARQTGETGARVQLLTKQLSALSVITGTGVAENATAAENAFVNWGVSTKDQSSKLDELFRISEITGVSVSKLGEGLAQGGDLFRAFGLNVTDSALLLGNFGKQGEDASGLLSALGIALKNLTEAGVAPSVGALEQITERIAKLDEVAGRQEAIKIFGKKAGPQLALDIQSGDLALKGLRETLEKNHDTILQAAADSYTFSQNMTILGHEVTVALQPLGAELTKAFLQLKPAIEGAISVLAGAIKLFTELPTGVQETVIGLLSMLAIIGPLKLAWAGVLLGIGSAVQAFTMLKTAMGLLFVVSQNPIVIGIEILVLLVTAFKNAQDHGSQFTTKLTELLSYLADAFVEFGRIVVEVLDRAQTAYYNFHRGVAVLAKKVGDLTMNQGLVNWAWDYYHSTEKAAEGSVKISTRLGELAKAAKEAASKGVDFVSDGVNTLTDEVKKFLPKGGDLNTALDGMGDKAKKAKEETKKLAEAWKNYKEETDAKSLADNLEKSLKAATKQIDFEGLFSQYKTAAIDSKAKELAERFKIGIDEAHMQAEKELAPGFQQIAIDFGTKLAEETKKAADASQQFFESMFEDMLTGSRFNLADTLKQIAVGFAASIASAVASALNIDVSGLSGPKAIGKILGEALMGGIKDAIGLGGTSGGSGGGLLSSLGSALGIGGGAAAGGGAGGMVAIGQNVDGSFIYGPASGAGAGAAGAGAGWLSTVGSAASFAGIAYGASGLISNLSDNKKDVKGGALSGAAAGAGVGTLIMPGVGTAIGAVLGGAIGAVAGMFGGSTDKGVLRRRGLRGQLQEIMGENLEFGGVNGPISLFTAGPNGGKDNFKPDFSNPNMGGAVGLANPFGQILGNKLAPGDPAAMNELAGMFANAIAEGKNFNEMLINTSSLMEKLGLNVQEAKDGVLQLFLDGKIKVDEFGADLQNLNLLAQNNLVGTGSVMDAVNILSSSLATPRTKLKALELAFTEASEIGTDQFGIVKDFITQKFGPEAGKAFETLRNLGINSFEDFANLSADQIFQLFSVVNTFGSEFVDTMGAAAEQGSDAFKDGTKGFFNRLDDLGDKADETGDRISNALDKGDKLKSQGSGSPNTSQSAKSGGGTTINVDARGASPGTEDRIKRVLQDATPQIVQQAVNTFKKQASRR